MAYTIDNLARDTGLRRSFLKSAYNDALHIVGDEKDAMELLLERLDTVQELMAMGTSFKTAWKGTKFAKGVKARRMISNTGAKTQRATSVAKGIAKRLTK